MASHAARPLATVKIDNPNGKGYMVINESDFDPKKHTKYGEKKLADLKVEELRGLAVEREIDGAADMKKADLLAALESED